MPHSNPASPPNPAKPKPVRNALLSRNITINGHRTSVRLEPEMWAGLNEICRRERASMHKVGSVVAKSKPANASLTAALRVFIMAYFRASSTEDGHGKAGHGRGVDSVVRAAPPLQTLTPSYAAMKLAQNGANGTVHRNVVMSNGFVNRSRF